MMTRDLHDYFDKKKKEPQQASSLLQIASVRLLLHYYRVLALY